MYEDVGHSADDLEVLTAWRIRGQSSAFPGWTDHAKRCFDPLLLLQKSDDRFALQGMPRPHDQSSEVLACLNEEHASCALARYGELSTTSGPA